LGGSNQAMLVASVALFVLLVMPSIVFMRIVHTRGLREELSASQTFGRGKPS
jgi:hypothetical protein